MKRLKVAPAMARSLLKRLKVALGQHSAESVLKGRVGKMRDCEVQT